MTKKDNVSGVRLKGLIRGTGAVGAAFGGIVAGTNISKNSKILQCEQYIAQHPEVMAELGSHANQKSPEELANLAVEKIRKQRIMTEEERLEAYSEFLALYTVKQRVDDQLEREFLASRVPNSDVQDSIATVALMAAGAAGGGLAGNQLGHTADNAISRRRKRKHDRIAEVPDAPEPGRG